MLKRTCVREDALNTYADHTRRHLAVPYRSDRHYQRVVFDHLVADRSADFCQDYRCRGRHGPAVGRVLRRDDLGACRHGSQRVLGARSRGRPGLGRVWCQRASSRRRPLRPAGAGGRRSVQWPTGPTARLARSRRPPDSAPTAFGRLMPGSPAGYGYQWWALPHAPTGIDRGAFSAIGAFGQYIYVNPTERVVVAIQSDWPQHHDAEAAAETFALVG